MSKRYQTKHNYWTRWSDSWLLPEEQVLSDVEYLQAMAALAGCSMCDAESGSTDVDDDGSDVGDDADVDPALIV